jgi:hypothetical protein
MASWGTLNVNASNVIARTLLVAELKDSRDPVTGTVMVTLAPLGWNLSCLPFTFARGYIPGYFHSLGLSLVLLEKLFYED